MGDRRISWFLCGFVVAVLISALSSAARAQDVPQNQAGSAASARSGATAKPADDDPDADGANLGATNPDDPFATDPDNQDGATPRPGIGLRPVVEDGDPGYTPESTQTERDGIIDAEEPAVVQDGVDPTVVDTRDPEDIALFENPSADPDPLLFQIEDLDPVRDNRTVSRLFRLEPYDPVGIKIGSFVLFPEVETGGSWYSNVFLSPTKQSDFAADLKPSARFVSAWSRHALELRAGATLSWYDDYTTEDDKGYVLEARGRLDITKRANIQALISREQTLESRSALDANSIGTRSELLTDRGELSYNQRFNRLSIQLRGSVADYKYSDTETAGVITNNGDRAYTQYEETARASWEFKPTLSAFTEVAVNQREHDSVAQTDLINRSSDGQRYRVGLSFGNTGKVLRGEVSLGYGVQTPDDSRLRAVDGLILDANTTWRVSDLTSVLFTARSDVSETTTADVGGSMYRYASVEVRHALRRYLIASAGLSWANQNSEDGIVDETEIRPTFGLEYYADSNTILFGRYAHSSYNAVGNLSDYQSDEIHFGVRFRR